VFEHAHSSVANASQFDPSSTEAINMEFPNMGSDGWDVTNNRPPDSKYGYGLEALYPPGYELTIDGNGKQHGPRQKIGNINYCPFCCYGTPQRKSNSCMKMDFAHGHFSPVVTIETVPMVTTSLLFDTGQSIITKNKNNFPIIEVLGLFAQSIAAW